MEQNTAVAAPDTASEWDDDMFDDEEIPEPMCDLSGNSDDYCEVCQ